MATRTVKNTVGSINWTSTGTWVEGVVPTASDDVVGDITKDYTGVILVIDGNCVCRSIDLSGMQGIGTMGLVSQGAGGALRVGASTPPPDGVALKFLTGQYSSSAAGILQFISTDETTIHTIDCNGSLFGNLNIVGTASYKMLSNFGLNAATRLFTLTSGTIDINGKSMLAGSFSCPGTVARTLTLGNSTLLISSTFTISSLTNLTITDNTGIINLNASAPTLSVPSGTNFNGTSLLITGTNGTVTIDNDCTVNNFIVYPTTTKTVSIAAGKTVTVTGGFWHYPTAGIVTWSTAGIISKTGGSASIYNMTNTATVFTGGCVWNTYNNCVITSGLGMTVNGGTYYLDYTNGTDSTVYPYGWWSVAYTGATGTVPIVDEIVAGDTSHSTAKITLVNPYEWSTGSGTLYFYGKSASFQAETVTCANGGQFNIAGDFTYCAWKTLSAGPLAVRIAEKDTIRVAKSGGVTQVVGNTGTWTQRSSGQAVTVAISSSSNSSGLIKIVTAAPHNCITGDIVSILLHTAAAVANGVWIITYVDDTSFTLDGSVYAAVGGAVGTIENVNFKCVKLGTTNNLKVDNCDVVSASAWQGTGTVTLNTTTYKQGIGSVSVAKTSPAANTLYAYKAIASTNFSGYQTISFWIQNSVAITANTQWKLCLCSNADGTGIVNTFLIPAIPSTATWVPLNLTMVEAGPNLGNAIQSVALYTGSGTPVTITILLDNISACTTNGLSLTSLIGKNSSETGRAYQWYPIQSIDNTIVVIDSTSTTSISGSRGYYEETDNGSVATYFRECIKTPMIATLSSVLFSMPKSGNANGQITFQGGYNTATNLLDGETFFDGQNSFGYFISSGNYLSYSHINAVRYSSWGCHNYCQYSDMSLISMINAFYFISVNNITIDNVTINNSTTSLYLNTTYKHTFSNMLILNNTGHGIYVSGGVYNTVFSNISCINNTSYGLYITYDGSNTFTNITSKYNNTYGLLSLGSTNDVITNLVTTGNSVGVVSYGSITLINPTINENSQFSLISFMNAKVRCHNLGNTVNNIHYIATDGGYIITETTIVHTVSGTSWRIYPTSTTRALTYPIDLTLATLMCKTGVTMTFNVWIKLSSTTDVGARLIAEAGQVGLVSAVYVDSIETTDWQQLSISITPTATYPVVFKVYGYWKAGLADESICIDDINFYN